MRRRRRRTPGGGVTVFVLTPCGWVITCQWSQWLLLIHDRNLDKPCWSKGIPLYQGIFFRGKRILIILYVLVAVILMIFFIKQCAFNLWFVPNVVETTNPVHVKKSDLQQKCLCSEVCPASAHGCLNQTFNWHRMKIGVSSFWLSLLKLITKHSANAFLNVIISQIHQNISIAYVCWVENPRTPIQ